MRNLTLAAAGWNLPNRRIVSIESAQAASWPRVDVLFLSPESISACWSRAVGDPVANFRSAAHEERAWSDLVALLVWLRRHLDQGGRLVMRLGEPAACRVRHRPAHPLFPFGSPMHAYSALAHVHPALFRLACGAVRVPLTPVQFGAPTSAWTRLLVALADHWQPNVALAPPAPAGLYVWASTPLGEPLAWSDGPLTVVPRFAGLAPEVEAEELLAAIGGMTGTAARGETQARNLSRRTPCAPATNAHSLGPADETAERNRLEPRRFESTPFQRSSLEQFAAIIGMRLRRASSIPSNPARLHEPRDQSIVGWIEVPGSSRPLAVVESLPARFDTSAPAVEMACIFTDDLYRLAALLAAAGDAESLRATLAAQFRRLDGPFRFNAAEFLLEPGERAILSHPAALVMSSDAFNPRRLVGGERSDVVDRDGTQHGLKSVAHAAELFQL